MHAQSDPFSYVVDYENSGVVVSESDTLYNVSCNITLNDTLNIEEIQLKVGTTKSGEDIFQHDFDFDSEDLPNEIIYTRTGQEISLGLGSMTHLSKHYFEIKLQYADGSQSNSVYAEVE